MQPGPGLDETIAGHECEHATVADAAGKSSDVCLAKDPGTFMGMPGLAAVAVLARFGAGGSHVTHDT
jgi:hypothetical protein